MARKGENIYRRKDGRWEARYIADYTKNGKAIYKSVYAKTYKEVKAKKQEAIRKQAELSYACQPKAGTVTAVSIVWMQNNAYKWKESTRCRYQEKLDAYILPEFGERDLSDIATDEIEDFIARMQAEGMPGRRPLGASSANTLLTIWKQLRLQALRTDCQVRFSAECISVKQRKVNISVLSEAEERILVSWLQGHLDTTNVGIFICLFTGIRIGEICALKCDDIDLDAKIIHVRGTMQRLPNRDSTLSQQDKTVENSLASGKSPTSGKSLMSGKETTSEKSSVSEKSPTSGKAAKVTKTSASGNSGKRVKGKTSVKIDAPKSESSVRDIPLSDELVKILRNFYKPGAFLLTGEKEHYVEPRTMENRFQRVLENCGLKRVTFHTLRHTFATRCIERGMDAKALAEILGHANVATTMNRYVHLSMKHKAEGMELLADLFAV